MRPCRRWTALTLAACCFVVAYGSTAGGGDVEIGCSLDELNQTSPDVIGGSFDVGDIHVNYGADRDVFTDKERIWHFVENKSDRAVAIDWRDPETDSHILYVPFHTGLPKNTLACIWHENELDAFVTRRESIFRINASPEEKKPILFYALASQRSMNMALELVLGVERAYEDQFGRITRLSALVEILPLENGGVDVDLLHYPPEAALLFSAASFGVSLEKGFEFVGNNITSISIGPLANLVQIKGDDIKLLERWSDETFVRVSGSPGGYYLRGLKRGDYSKPIFLETPDGRLAIGASLVLRPAEGPREQQ